ncbi:hypothetical protein GW923_04470 [Candidatus Pacearchaeota archaeon]|nr:hypothetical protein [Candidatus Pacearchaeota archaeon]
MRSKHLGVLIVIISMVIIGLFFYFDSVLDRQNLDNCLKFCEALGESSCSLESCPFYEEHHSNERILFIIGLLAAFLGGIGFYISLTKTEKLVEYKEYDLTRLNLEEKEIFKFIRENKDKGVYQSNIVEKFNLPKSKTSRILDKMERLDIVEKKRRGMTNLIFLK